MQTPNGGNLKAHDHGHTGACIETGVSAGLRADRPPEPEHFDLSVFLFCPPTSRLLFSLRTLYSRTVMQGDVSNNPKDLVQPAIQANKEHQYALKVYTERLETELEHLDKLLVCSQGTVSVHIFSYDLLSLRQKYQITTMKMSSLSTPGGLCISPGRRSRKVQFP